MFQEIAVTNEDVSLNVSIRDIIKYRNFIVIYLIKVNE